MRKTMRAIKHHRSNKAEHARKKIQRLEQELTNATSLVQWLAEANHASTHAANLNTDIQQDLISLDFMNISINIRANTNTIPSHTPFLLSLDDNQENESIPESNDDDVFIVIDIELMNFNEKSRYKKFFEGESSPRSDVFLTGLSITIESEVNFSDAVKHSTPQASYEDCYSRSRYSSLSSSFISVISK